MFTEHIFLTGDARNLEFVENNSIDLVVTSPPYPMIKMWDSQFATMDPNIELYLKQGEGSKAFEAMHLLLDEAWKELHRVVKDGAYICINVGDAARSINSKFELFVNHSRIQVKLLELGFKLFPLIIWRKQTNAPNKFMGSGMLPAGAYVTLEHEYVILARKGPKRVFKTLEEKQNRKKSAYFWEERNTWFSDLWDFKGTRQETKSLQLRKRSAAFPILLPFRLINMFSVHGDKVLDPFAGMGTTVLAAMAAGRNSIACEVDNSFIEPIRDRLTSELSTLNRLNLQRLKAHRDFIEKYQEKKGKPKYLNSYFHFPVITRQEEELKIFFIETIEITGKSSYKVYYYDDQDVQALNLENLGIGIHL